MHALLNKGFELPQKKRIVFLGDSITDNGLYIALMNTHFMKHMPEKRLSFINLGVNSETASGLSEPDHPWPRPCVHQRLDRILKESRPDYVVACYGMNDGIYYPFSEERFKAYQEGMLTLIGKIKQAGAKVILLTPPPFDKKSFIRAPLQPEGMEKYSWKEPYAGYDAVIKRYGEWVLSLGDRADQIVNIHKPMVDHLEQIRRQKPDYISGDGIHPNAQGHWVIAKVLMKELFNLCLEQMPDYVQHPEQSEIFSLALQHHRLLSAAWKEHVGHDNANKVQALPLEEAQQQGTVLEGRIQDLRSQTGREEEQMSEWNGYTRRDFFVKGREALVVLPKEPAPEKPWIWRAEFFGAFDYADRALLEKGWHIAYYRISHMYGCPEAVELMEDFRQTIAEKFQLAPKAVFFGFSRGGLYAFNYTAAYPERVALLYLDAPVLDIRSWPAGKGEGTGAVREWEDCKEIYGLTEATAMEFRENPLDKIEKVAGADIPVLLVAGDADEVVPYPENGAVLEKKFRELQGNIKVIIKPGVGHHPHSLENPQSIVDFILENR